MKLIEIPPENPLEILRQTQKMSDGILETNMLLQGTLPGRDKKHQICKLQLSDDRWLLICYFPNGLGNNSYVSLQLTIGSSNVVTSYLKTETMVVARNGNRMLRSTMDNFQALPNGAAILNGIIMIQKLYEQRQFLTHDKKLLFVFRVWFDINKSAPIRLVDELLPKHEYQRMRQKVYDPSFGDSAFIVAGVKMYGHLQIMVKNDETFRLTFSAKPKIGMYYEFPDTYPQIFEKMLIGCYVKDDDVCRICVGYHNWLRRADKSAQK